MNYEVIEHHGVLGQKWGIRRYQNADGSLTQAGKKHIQQIEKKDVKWANKYYDIHKIHLAKRGIDIS